MAEDDFNLLELEEDAGEYVMSSEELLGYLETAWLNEKFAPELLPHKSNIVDCMLDQLNTMQDNVDRNRARNPDIQLSIHQLEIERIRYTLTSYLRKRLQKIEYFCADLLGSPDEEKMSEQEIAFAKEYQGNFESYLNSVALKNMPISLQSIDMKDMKNMPNINSFVFVKVNESVQNVHIDDGLEDASKDNETTDLIAGDQHLMSYKPIKELLTSGHVSLI